MMFPGSPEKIRSAKGLPHALNFHSSILINIHKCGGKAEEKLPLSTDDYPMHEIGWWLDFAQ